MKKYILFILILMALFYSSAQTYEEQSLIPDLMRWLPNEPFKGVLSLLQIPYWGTIVSVEERGYHAFIEFLIRKGAHVVIFGALAIATYIMVRRFRLAFILTVVLAIADEFHQSLTGGRTPTIHDVLLDSIGAVLALSIVIIYKRFHNSKWQRKISPHD
ncbi:VanZ family protein [Paenisporosarcina sp.]|uniref:VanZ family protein n=1 Tax=Paenisporosarcina sp. TaxID=1932001 RepID=UPI003C7517B9